MKVAHVITSLETGGAQVMLGRLSGGLRGLGVGSHVVVLRNGPTPVVLPEQVPLDVVGMRPSRPDPRLWARLRRLLDTIRPDVVHTWLYHADLLGGLAARFGRQAPVVWGLHHTAGPHDGLKLATRVVRRLNGRLSRTLPDRIVCCGHAVRASHVALGFAQDRMVVIPNGVDVDAFVPDPGARGAVRHELGAAADTIVIGLLARFHAQKDPRTFVQAAAMIAREQPGVHFLVAGQGMDARNDRLRAWIEESGATDRWHLLGVRADVPRLMAACDIVSLASAYGEGQPLVLAEAMACGVPCVATDVGDSARVIGDAGRVVPPRDPAALAEAWRALLALGVQARRQLGAAARARIADQYSLGECVRRHAALYAELAIGSRARSVP